MKLIDNATDIRIPKDTIVIMAGVQGAGKTFFTNQYFDKDNIICNDEIFWEEFKKSGKKDMIDSQDYEDICIRTLDTITEMIKKYSKEKSYTVLDSIGYSFDKRIECIIEMKKTFKNIILIVINPNFEVIYKQLQEREKASRKSKMQKGITIPDRITMIANKYDLDKQISDKSISYKTTTTYIVRDMNNVKVSIETM